MLKDLSRINTLLALLHGGKVKNFAHLINGNRMEGAIDDVAELVVVELMLFLSSWLSSGTVRSTPRVLTVSPTTQYGDSDRVHASAKGLHGPLFAL